MRRIVCLFVLFFALAGYSLPADAAGFRGGGSMHVEHGGGFRGGHFEGREHFRGHGGGHFRSSFFIAPVLVSPFWYSYGYYDAPVYEPSQTIIYQDATPADSGYLYYCKSSELYYPYTKACPEGWLKVLSN